MLFGYQAADAVTTPSKRIVANRADEDAAPTDLRRVNLKVDVRKILRPTFAAARGKGARNCRVKRAVDDRRRGCEAPRSKRRRLPTTTDNRQPIKRPFEQGG